MLPFTLVAAGLELTNSKLSASSICAVRILAALPDMYMSAMFLKTVSSSSVVGESK